MGFSFEETGVPQIDEEKCARCGRCAEVCHTETLQMLDGRPVVARRTFMGCFACGQCMAVCPTGGITVRGRRLDPADLVDLSPPGTAATAEGLEALLLQRRSTRDFSAAEVDRATADRILEMAATAPMGIPPSEVGVSVILGRAEVHQFAQAMIGAFGKTVKTFRPLMLTLMRPFLGKTQHAMFRDFVVPLLKLMVERWDRGQDAFCYDAPAAMLFHHGPTADAADGHIVTTYAMLAAESLGLGTCWIGTVEVLNHFAALKTRYGVPEENTVSSLLLLGYPAVRFERSLRRKLAQVRFVGGDGP